ncbi:hypothetical protein N7493_001404 [Penicillium malachiteum]|uniref:Non-specific serine/threonine protein kinase n=1 Tax=Penicillium malachiteum TaxID=1324776 RepID=A0AAD6HUN9_9EURO|nr:hypothetical protein N7493_001404 [Penicillium malachiteum]
MKKTVLSKLSFWNAPPHSVKPLADVSTLVLRLSNPAAMKLNSANRVQNEVAAIIIAHEGLRAFKPGLEVLVPAIYAWKGRLRDQLKGADKSPVIEGWSAGDLRGRIEEFIAHGISNDLIQASVDSSKRVLIHGDFTMNNMLVNPDTNQLTVVLDFDFSSIGPPAHLFFSSLQDLGSNSDQTGGKLTKALLTDNFEDFSDVPDERDGVVEAFYHGRESTTTNDQLREQLEKSINEQKSKPTTTFKRVWDRAYDELAEDQGTAGLRQAVMESAVKAGQAKIEKSRCENLTGMMGNLVDFIFEFKDVIDLAVSVNPQAALPWAGICIGLQLLLNPSQVSKDQLDGITYVTSRMEWYCSLTDHLLIKENIEVGAQSYQVVLDMLEDRVVTLYKKLILYQMKSVSTYYKSRGWVFLRNIIDWDDWDGQLQDVKEAETAVQKDSDQYNTLHSKTLLGKLITQSQAELKALGNLQQTLQEYMEEQRRSYMDDKLSKCLQDLYVVDPAAVMNTIQGQNDQLLFAACEWILHESAYQKFTDWSDPCKVLWLHGPAGTGKSMLIIGIITELSRRSLRVAPGLAYFYFQALTQDRTGPAHALRALIWMLLIQQPHLSSHIQDVHKNSGAGAFTNPAATWTLVSIFKAMLGDKDLHPAYLALDALDGCETGKTGVQMIRSLVSESLGITNKIKRLLSSRPEIDIYYQVRKGISHGTVLQIDFKTQKGAVDAYIAQKLLELEDIPFEYKPDALDQISKEITACCFAYRPLSYDELHVLANLPSGIPSRIIVQKCGSFLTVNNEVVRLIHNSAREYLEIYFNRDYQEILIDMHHASICDHSIEAMSRILKRNMWEGVPHDAGIKKIEAPQTDPRASIRYSCEFWADHLSQTRTSICDGHDVVTFLQCHLLHWLEPLSLIRKISVALPAVRKLLVQAKSILQASKNLIILLNDAERFIRNNIQIMEMRPLQLYGTCLAFRPSKSEMRVRHWRERLSFIKNFTGTDEAWSPCVQIIESEERIRSLKISPNGNFTAIAMKSPSMSTEGEPADMIQIWDVTTGVCAHTVEDKSLQGNAITFSPNSKLITVAFNDVLTLLDTVAWDIESVTFSPDSKTLAAVSNKLQAEGPFFSITVLQLWDVESDQCRQVFELPNTTHTVAYLPEGKAIITLARNRPGHLLDLTSGEILRTFDKFDMLSTRPISISEVQETPGPESSTELQLAVAVLSSNGKRIAVPFAQGEVDFHDVATGTIERTFSHHPFAGKMGFPFDVIAVAFQGHNDQKSRLRLWDVTAGEQIQEIPVPVQSAARYIYLSWNWKLIACIETDYNFDQEYASMVRLWDIANQKPRHILDVEATSCAISPDSKTLVTSSNSQGVQLRDTETGELLKALGLDTPVKFEYFTSDGKVLVTKTGLIDLATGMFSGGKVAHAVISLYGAWIERDGQRLLCVPSEHSQGALGVFGLPSAQWDDRFVVGTSAGNVIFMDFGEV